MISRRSLIGIAAAGAAVVAFAGTQLTDGAVSSAAASQRLAFDIPAFQDAQAAGKPILVDIYADWCSTCARQKPIISQLSDHPRFKDLVIFEVNYDSQKPIVRAFNSPVMKSEFTQFACGATMITSIAVSPCISAMMAMARSTSD